MYQSIAEVRAANRSAGLHFFDRDAMRHFRSRIDRVLIAGHYFVTAEADSDNSDPRWTVRYAEDNGRIRTVGKFMAHRSRSAARTAARQHAASVPTH